MNAQTFDGFKVTALKAIARDRNLVGYSRMRRAELIALIIEDSAKMQAEIQRDMDHAEAIEMNATIDEAYAHKAEDAGITLPAYLADKKSHMLAGHIKLSGFWNCCENNPTKVIVWDNGAKQAVCSKDARAYSGEVIDLPAGKTVECMTCGESYLIPATEDKAAQSELKAFMDEEAHTHSLNRREVGLSGCAYGCKIYRCETCGEDEVLHNATYGCRTK